MPDPLDFLDDPKGSNAEPTPTPEPVTVQPSPPPASPDPPKATPEAAPGSQPPAAPQPSPKEPGEWTAAMAFDEREKRQAAERERDDFKRKLEAATKVAAPDIDPLLEPEKFREQLDAQRVKDREDVKFEMTRMFTVQKHGEDVVKAAETWLEGELRAGRIAFQSVSNQLDPYDFVVKQHKRFMSLQKIGDDDPETWAERTLRERGWTPPVEAVPETGRPRADNGQFVAAAPSPQQTPLPKPSLASAPAASGATPKTPTGPGVAFDTVFKQ